MKQLWHALGRRYITRYNRHEQEAQQFIRVNERPIEYRFIFEHLNREQPVTVLDVGTGTTALPQLIRSCGFVVSAIDNVRDYWPRGMFNRHFHVLDEDICDPRLQQRFDAISCVSTLEHIRDHRRAVAAMFNLLNPGGILLLTCPYNETIYSENVYVLPDSLYGSTNPFICRSFSRAELNSWLEGSGGQIIAQEYWRCFTGPLWTQGELVRPPQQVTPDQPHQLTCLALRAAA